MCRPPGWTAHPLTPCHSQVNHQLLECYALTSSMGNHIVKMCTFHLWPRTDATVKDHQNLIEPPARWSPQNVSHIDLLNMATSWDRSRYVCSYASKSHSENLHFWSSAAADNPTVKDHQILIEPPSRWSLQNMSHVDLLNMVTSSDRSRYVCSYGWCHYKKCLNCGKTNDYACTFFCLFLLVPMCRSPGYAAHRPTPRHSQVNHQWFLPLLKVHTLWDIPL
jgi:hypothetical protein